MAWALGPAPCTFRCLSRRFYSDEGRLIQFWAPRNQPVAPGDTRACCPKGEAPEEAPELVFLLRCPLSPCLPGALEASLQLCGPASSWRRCCLLPGADPPGLGVPAGGPFPRTRPPVHARGLSCVALSHLCPSPGPRGDGPPRGWQILPRSPQAAEQFPQRAGSHGFGVIMKFLSDNTSVS